MNKKGFTLIELLVVVLIIGILSAVALPQYQKTVLKSRAAEAWTNLNALYKAGQAYCLENPSQTSVALYDDLPITIKATDNFSYGGGINCSIDEMELLAYYSKGSSTFVLSWDGHRRLCVGSSCKDLGFVNHDSNTNCMKAVSGSGCYYMD